MDDERLDALVGGIAEYLFKRWAPDQAPPWIGDRDRTLKEPWFAGAGDNPALKEYLTFSSPAEFKNRNIMTDDAPLRRAAGARREDRLGQDERRRHDGLRPPSPYRRLQNGMTRAASEKEIDILGRHIFVDNSNILGGALRTKAIREPDVPWAALRLHLEHFFKLLEHGGDVQTRAFAASGSKTADAVWSRASDNGYDTYVLTRVETANGKTQEQAVDEIIHLVMANAILDFLAPQTLVLASGDGKDSDFGTSFFSQIERALKHGWDVEIWSWSATMSDRYASLKKRYVGRIKLQSLDPHYDALTWLVGGVFHHGDHVSVEVKGRHATPLIIIDEPANDKAATDHETMSCE